MILLALAKPAAILKYRVWIPGAQPFSFIRLLPSTTYFPEEKLSSTFLPSIFWKYSKTFDQQPEIIQRLFRLQNCLSRRSQTISRKYSKTFRPAINRSNQQQQSTAATSSSNQQQQPAAAINNSNQQQQSTTRLAATTSVRPTSSTYTINADFC